MATIYYPPDPYNGWRNLNPYSNYPASRILADTSMTWHLVLNLGFLRIYEQRQ